MAKRATDDDTLNSLREEVVFVPRHTPEPRMPSSHTKQLLGHAEENQLAPSTPINCSQEHVAPQ